MRDNSKIVSDIIHERNTLRLDIFDSQNNHIGDLSPVTVSVINNDEIIQELTRWRNQASKYFLTQFTATHERTRNWLKNVVLKDYSRLLFIINSKTKPIGNYGFKGLFFDSVQVDNLLRGEMGGHPRLIYYAEVTLIRWLFETFKIRQIYGFVLSDNSIALNLHKSIGFRLSELIPLHKTEMEGKVHLEMGEPGYPSKDGLYVQKVELKLTDFVISEA